MSEQALVIDNDQSDNHPAVQPMNPAQMLSMAVQKGIDVEQLDKLMQLNERWEANEARKAYFDAFSTFQAIVPTIKKSKDGHNYKYAPIGDIALQIRPALEQCQLSYRFEINDSDGLISVTCIVSHRLGHQERTTMSGAPDTSGSKNAIQSHGSTVSYLQRYTLIGAFGLTIADEDIDGRVEGEIITEGQAASIKARLEATGSNVQAFCHMLSIPNVDAMPAGKYASADKKLTQKEVTQAQEIADADS